MAESDLLALIERVEKLEGPDTTVDELILLATGWTLERAKGLGERATWIDPEGYRTARRQGDGWFKPTDSIDEATTLVPEGWGWSVTFRPDGGGIDASVFGMGDHDPTMVCDNATTAPNALTAAALRACLSIGES